MEKQTKIALLLEDKFDLMASIIAVLKARHIFVPLEVEDPKERLELLFQEADAEYIITDSPEVKKNFSRKQKILFLQDINDKEECIKKEPELPVYDFEDPIFIYFTSGSTGKPKPILGENKSLAQYFKWVREDFEINSSDRVAYLAPVSFDATLTDLFVPFFAGGTVCIPKDRKNILVEDTLSAWMSGNKISVLFTTPSKFKLIKPPRSSEHDYHFKYIILASEKPNTADIKKWENEGIIFVNKYGPTEANIIKTCHFITEQDIESGNIPIGKPLPDTKVLILDKHLKLCPPGVEGEIYIGSPYLTKGYYNKPDLTAEVFKPDPFEPGQYLYKTGDLAKMRPDGHIDLIGRVDDQVKIRGHRVELGEIENVLAKHKDIKEVVVKFLKDDNGQEQSLAAYYITHSGQKPPSKELRDLASEYLPDYMIPAYYIQVSKFPLNQNGKLDRKQLPAPTEKDLVKNKYELPQTATEKKLASIWQEVLGIKQVGRYDNFFNLGGHSLKAIKVLSRINKELESNLSLKELFQYPELQKLGEIIDDFYKNELLNKMDTDLEL
jgi:amino acid adenylation domain-containing protein